MTIRTRMTIRSIVPGTGVALFVVLCIQGFLPGGTGDLVPLSGEELRLAEALHAARRGAGDGAGADVGSLEAYQTRFLDSGCSFPPQCGGPCNIVLLVWQEDTLNPSGVRVLVNGVELGTVAGLTEVPGVNGVNIISVPAGVITFRVEDVVGGTFDEAEILVLDAQPFDDPQDLACSAGSAGAGGTCQLIVSWTNGEPSPESYEAYVDDSYVATASGEENLLIVNGVSPGTHTVGLVGITQQGPKSYHVGCFVETTFDLSCTDGPCDPPLALRLCQASYDPGEGNSVRADWLNGEDSYAVGVNGYVDGELVGTIPTDPEAGTARIARFGSLAPGEHTIGVQGDCGAGVVSEITEGTLTVLETSPHTTPIEGTVECTFDPVVPSTTAVWANATPSLFIDVFLYVVSQSQLYFAGTITGDATTVTLENTAEGDYIVLQFFATTGGGCYGSELVSCGAGEIAFHRGDADQNGELELTDAIQILGYLFLGTSTRVPECEDAGDADDSGVIELTDAIRILGYLFLGTSIIPAPGAPESPCGPDPTTENDPLGCVSYDAASCATP